MADTKTSLDGLPAFAKVAAVVGVPSAIALYLVWVLAGGVASAAQLRALDQKVDMHVARTEVVSSERSRQLDAQTRLLRLVCQSVAKTEAVRVECSR